MADQHYLTCLIFWTPPTNVCGRPDVSNPPKRRLYPFVGSPLVQTNLYNPLADLTICRLRPFKEKRFVKSGGPHLPLEKLHNNVGIVLDDRSPRRIISHLRTWNYVVQYCDNRLVGVWDVGD